MKKKLRMSQDTAFFWFVSIVTAFLTGVTKIGGFTAILFVVFVTLYLKLLHFIFGLAAKFFKNFILATVEHGEAGDN